MMEHGSHGNENPHIGSSYENWLNDAGIREDVTRRRSRP
jgi:hypothetical protein